MFKNIKTYGDLVEFIQENELEDKQIVLGVEGYNTYCYQKGDGSYELLNELIYIQEINDFIVLSDSCGNYEEDLFRQEQLKEEETNVYGNV